MYNKYHIRFLAKDVTLGSKLWIMGLPTASSPRVMAGPCEEYGSQSEEGGDDQGVVTINADSPWSECGYACACVRKCLVATARSLSFCCKALA